MVILCVCFRQAESRRSLPTKAFKPKWHFWATRPIRIENNLSRFQEREGVAVLLNSLKTSLAISFLFLSGMSCSCLGQDQEVSTWNKEKAAEYLDSRAETWLEWESSNRGNDTSCVACHTGQPYAMARHLLRIANGTVAISNAEKKTIAGVKLRVKDFDSVTYYYEFSDKKIAESRATEAIQNALICATLDSQNGLKNVSEVTLIAMDNLWKAQETSGANKGGWSWLDFELEPWESSDAQFYGAAMAASAVGIAPKYVNRNAKVTERTEMLREYLTSRYERQHLHNKMEMLLAASRLDGLLTDDQKRRLVDLVFARQKTDGGWSLVSLGSKTTNPDFKWKRKDNSDQIDESDGYGTGYAVYVLRNAGVASDDQRIGKAVNWLKTNQLADGNWRGNSLNKKRNASTNIGKFMDDAATAYAVLALLETQSP